MRTDKVVSRMSSRQIALFLEWLESQADRHYAQRQELRREGRLDVAYNVKMEAHTYERVHTAFLEVLSGRPPSLTPSRE